MKLDLDARRPGRGGERAARRTKARAGAARNGSAAGTLPAAGLLSKAAAFCLRTDTFPQQRHHWTGVGHLGPYGTGGGSGGRG